MSQPEDSPRGQHSKVFGWVYRAASRAAARAATGVLQGVRLGGKTSGHKSPLMWQ